MFCEVIYYYLNIKIDGNFEENCKNLLSNQQKPSPIILERLRTLNFITIDKDTY